MLLGLGRAPIGAMAGLTGLLACAEPDSGARVDVGPPMRIGLEVRTVLSDLDQDFYFGSLRPYVLPDALGRVHSRIIPYSRFAVFDSAGRLVRTVGEEGRGPGEFGAAFPVMVDPADTLWVWDPMLHRASLFSPDLEFVRTAPFRFRPSSFLPDGSVLVIQTVLEPHLIGHAAYRVSRDGAILSSFGQNPPGYRRDQRHLFEKVGDATDEGLVWLSARGRYELELWDPAESRPIRTIRPHAPWFEESEHSGGDFRVDRPPSAIVRVSSQPSGPLWVLAQTASRDWTRCCVGDPDPGEPITWHLRARYFDWVLQALDPEDGTVLAERRFESPVSMTEGGTELVAIEEAAETGFVSYHLLHPFLIKSHPPDSPGNP